MGNPHVYSDVPPYTSAWLMYHRFTEEDIQRIIIRLPFLDFIIA